MLRLPRCRSLGVGDRIVLCDGAPLTGPLREAIAPDSVGQLGVWKRAAMAALQRVGTAGPEPDTAAGATDTVDAAGAALSVELERPDFEQALREVSPSLTAEMLERLHAWAGSRSSSE